jgi:hypothetical protein
LERHAPEPVAVGPIIKAINAAYVLVAVEDVVVLVLPGAVFPGGVGAAENELHGV